MLTKEDKYDDSWYESSFTIIFLWNIIAYVVKSV
jgi:hypothetical protein